MTAYKQSEETINNIIGSNDCMAVAKLPIREMVTKCIPGEKYFCTDESKWNEAKEGECLITRTFEDGTKDTYKNKKGPRYDFEGGKTWDDLQPGESAFGKLKDGPEYDRFAMFAKPEDTVDAVWNQTQDVTRPNSFVTVIYADKPFDMSEEGKYGSKQIVLNNNAGDIHPIDTQRKDKDGHPVVIGELPLTASPIAREKELREYVAQNYNGEMPKHLLPVIRNINAEKNAGLSKVMTNSKGNEGK